MKFIVPAFVIIGILAIVLFTMLSINASLPSGWTLSTSTTTTTTISKAPTGTPFRPSNFQGPTSDPHVKGPTGNPPNY
jgi:hypothetical protein